MDANGDSTQLGNGNGSSKPDHPEITPLPSAAAAPSGAPVSASPADAPAGAPEPLVVVDEDLRDENGRIRPGKTLNKKGRPPGSPNLNAELQKAVKKYKLGQKSYLELLLTKSLQDVEYAKLVVPKILSNVDVPAPAGGVTIHNTPQANASANHETNVELVAKLLADADGREDAARFTERVAACGGFSRDAGNVRN